MTPVKRRVGKRPIDRLRTGFLLAHHRRGLSSIPRGQTIEPFAHPAGLENTKSPRGADALERMVRQRFG